MYMLDLFWHSKTFSLFCLFLQESYSKNNSELTLRRFRKNSETTQRHLIDGYEAIQEMIFQNLDKKIFHCAYIRGEKAHLVIIWEVGSTKVKEVKRVAKSERFQPQ